MERKMQQQYNNVYPSTEIYISNLEKTGRYSVYDYCYVPKYICLSFSYYRYYYVEFNIRNNSFAPPLSKIIKFEFSTQEVNNGEYSANRRWQIVFL